MKDATRYPSLCRELPEIQSFISVTGRLCRAKFGCKVNRSSVIREQHRPMRTALTIRSSLESGLVCPDSNAMLADEEMRDDIAECLEALLSDQREKGKCAFVDISQMAISFV
jgi:hypothetical protein